MKIERGTPERISELEELVRENYQGETNQRRKQQKLYKNLKNNPFHNGKGSLIAIGWDYRLLGMVSYKVLEPKSQEEFMKQATDILPAKMLVKTCDTFKTPYQKANNRMVFEQLTRAGLRHNTPKAYIKSIHSYEKGIGVGSALMDMVGELESLDEYFLFSLNSAVGFYLKRNFVRTGIYVSGTLNPVMARS